MSSVVPRGLINVGNVCYFSSLLQCLFSLKSFVKHKYIEVIPWNYHLSLIVLRKMNKLSPNESSSEYFQYINDYYKCYDLFKYTYNTTKVCLNCDYVTNKTDSTINNLIHTTFMDLFEKKETIHDVLCDRCKQRSDCNTITWITNASDNIVVSLNKYFSKDDFKYPLDFTITTNNISKKYNLVATIEHVGSLGSGHYTARVKRDDKYYHIDDDVVKEIQEFYQLNETYMLFYEKE